MESETKDLDSIVDYYKENGKNPEKQNEYLTYDDVQIIPKYSEVASRSNCDLSSQFTKNYKMEAPFIASPMDTICEEDMAFEMWRLGGVGIIHRFDDIETQANRVKEVINRSEDYLKENNLSLESKPRNFSAAIGATGEYMDRASALIDAGANVLLLDVAHGHHSYVKEALCNLNNEWPEVDYIAGSIATKSAAKDLIEWGADALRVGVGNGCFTPSMEVDTNRGRVPISEVEIGDSVQTHTGKWKGVVDTFEYEELEEVVVINDEIECTPDHEFYVVHEKYCDVVDENNIHRYAEWIEAKNLSYKYYIVEYD